MKKLVTAAAAIALVVSAGAAQAQQPEPGDLAMFADAEGTMTTLDVTPGVAFDVFAVAFDVPGGLKAYELGISGVEALGLFQLGFELFGPVPLNIGSAQDRNFIVGTGACIPETGAAVLVQLNLLGTTAIPADSPLCVTGSTPSSFDDFGSPPGFSDCNNQISPFGVATNGGDIYPDGCLILNATGTGPVDTESSSFGEVKARF
ncbi:MAG TPA: hypothetical protein VKA86_12960 [Candidatus Krumholzibacteria bacterium]|nr:hypothetical protein [Candidatus Krumholzibacteria bacterium]